MFFCYQQLRAQQFLEFVLLFVRRSLQPDTWREGRTIVAVQTRDAANCSRQSARGTRAEYVRRIEAADERSSPPTPPPAQPFPLSGKLSVAGGPFLSLSYD
jgi:hypothetical protein